MCGIAGFTWADEQLVKKMSNKLAHRGPDDAGIYVDREISLGHRRLAIIDLSAKGHQPMLYKNLVITYNGEIYNYQELKKDLSQFGYEFSSTSDTEVILAAYHKWGVNCFVKLNGIFALAIWDSVKKELVLARDHLGVKPLYYCHSDHKFLFASEIKALLESDIKKQVNLSSLNFLLRVLYVPEPETMFEGVRKIKSGHYVVIKNGDFKEQKYWDIDNFENLDLEISDPKERIHDLLNDSLQRQLISDRPLGVFLSGGWDSSTILGLMREQGVKDIVTFSSGFATANEKYNQDLQLARETARYYETKHHEVKFAASDVLDTLEKAVYHLDEPNASPTILPMFDLAQATKQDVSVVLGGDGGDELFAGYPRHTLSYYLNKFQALPYSLRQKLIPYRFLEMARQKQDLQKKLNIPAGYDRFAMFKVYTAEAIGQLMPPGLFRPELVPDYFKDNFFNQTSYDDFEKSLMYMEIKNWLTVESLWKTDRMTMAAGLEARVPLLDYRLVELAFQIPTSLKVKYFSGKWIFKQVVKKYVPEHLHGIKKRGWLTPGSSWLKQELKDIMESVLNEEYCPEMKVYFNMPYIKSLYTRHLSGDSFHMNQLWSVLTFAIWYNKFLKP